MARLAAVVAMLLMVAGCARSVAGSAQVVPGAVLPTTVSVQTVSSSAVATGTAEPGTPESQTPDSGTPESQTPESQASSSDAPGSDVGTAPATTPAQSGVPIDTTLSAADGTITMAVGSPRVTIDVYAEPICPPCAKFEEADGNLIHRAVEQGRLKVRLHLMNFLDAESASGNYSTRANAALFCLARNDPHSTAFARLEETVFSTAFQPEEQGASDHTDAEVGQAAKAAGASAASLSCIGQGTLKPLAAKSDSASGKTLSAGGGVSTPNVLSGGRRVELTSGWLAELLAK